MKYPVLLLLAVGVLCGCKSSSVPGVDPFFGRTTVQPVPTGPAGRPGDPAYALGPDGRPLPQPSYAMPGAAGVPSGMPIGTVTAPGNVTPFPANTSATPTSDGLPWISPSAVPSNIPGNTPAATTPGAPYSAYPLYAPPRTPAAPGGTGARSMPTNGVGTPGSPYGTSPYPGAASPTPPYSPSPRPGVANPSPAAPGGFNTPGSAVDYRGTSTPSADAARNAWTASSGAGSAPNTIRIVESGRPSGDMASSAGVAVSDSSSAAADAAAIVANRPRIVRNLPSRSAMAGDDGIAAKPVNIADLPPADFEGSTLR